MRGELNIPFKVDEAFWKFLKEYLKEAQGVAANSLKFVFRGIRSRKYLSNAEIVQCLNMTDRRNETAYTYKQAVARKIYKGGKKYSALNNTVPDRLANTNV